MPMPYTQPAAAKIAAQTAHPALTNITQAMEQWDAAQTRTLHDKIGANKNAILTLGTQLELHPAETDETAIRAEILSRMQEAKAALEDPTRATAAAEELKLLAEQFSQLNALADQKRTLADEEKQRDLARFRARQALDLEDFQSKKHSARALAKFRLQQLDELHARQRELEAPDEQTVGDVVRATERARLLREGNLPRNTPTADLRFQQSDANARNGLNVSPIAESSALYQRNLLTKNGEMHAELRLIREALTHRPSENTAIWAS